MNAVEWMNGYITQTASFSELTGDMISELMTYRPRSLHEMFPDEFSKDDKFLVMRGCCFLDEESFNSFLESIKDGMLREDKLTSWSRTGEVALRFMKGAGLEKGSKIYGGICFSAEVSVDEILFSSNEALYDLEEEGYDEAADLVQREDEFVLLPGVFKINVDKTFIV